MNNLDTDDGAYCKSMIDMAWRFDEHIYDWWFKDGEDGLHDYINDPSHSQNGFVFIEFSYKQLGKDDVWLETQKRALQGDLTLVKRELLLEWTLGSNTSPFSEEQLDILSRGIIKEPFGRIYLLDNKYSIIMLKNVRNTANKNYVIGVDVGGGLGRDASAITIIDPATQEPVGVFKNNHISITDLAEMLEELVTTYLPKAVLIPERNNGGITLIEILEKTPVDANLYYRTKSSQGIERISTEPPDIYDMKQSSLNKNKKTMIVKGVDTTAKSRDLMINEILFNIVTNRPELINNDSMLDEIKTLERKKTGKIEHADKKHDDQIFSFLIGLYPIFFDPNIGKFITNISDGLMTESDNDEREDTREKKINRSIKSTLELSRNKLMARNSLPDDLSGIINAQPKRSIEDDEKEFREMQKPNKSRSTKDKLARFRRTFM